MTETNPDEALKAPRPGPILPTGYYLTNLETLLAFVEERSGDLLTPEERNFLESFRNLSLDARRLWTRLVMRSRKRFRVDQLKYPEIDDIARTIDELTQENNQAIAFARLVEEPAVEERLAAMRVDELRRFALTCGRTIAREANRQEILLRATEATWGANAAPRLASTLPLLDLLQRPHLETLRILFFGNFHQDLEQFVLRDIGMIRFEPYDLVASWRRFSSREEFDEVRAWRRVRMEEELPLREGLERMLGKEEREWPAAVASVRPRARVYVDECLGVLAREAERGGDLERALGLYGLASRPPSRERAVRCLERLGRLVDARSLVSEMLASPRDESERIFAARRSEVLEGARRRGRRRRSTASFEQWSLEVGEVSRVGVGQIEARTLEALIARGYQGAFAENFLWRSLFGLFFWEELWAPIPGAFAHPFQYGPSDLHDGWRQHREPAITNKLIALAAESSPGPRLLDRWREKHATASSLVFFPPESFPALQLASSCLSGRVLAPIFDRLSRDLARYDRGFPDLFLIDPDGAPLVAEVKGPNDVLRPEQIGWLEHFAANGLRAAVIHSLPRAAPVVADDPQSIE
jgi:hypothetical protein